jgi:hypothetical protein
MIQSRSADLIIIWWNERSLKCLKNFDCENSSSNAPRNLAVQYALEDEYLSGNYKDSISTDSIGLEIRFHSTIYRMCNRNYSEYYMHNGYHSFHTFYILYPFNFIGTPLRQHRDSHI